LSRKLPASSLQLSPRLPPLTSYPTEFNNNAALLATFSLSFSHSIAVIWDLLNDDDSLDFVWENEKHALKSMGRNWKTRKRKDNKPKRPIGSDYRKMRDDFDEDWFRTMSL
jgi:hypothetical protein